MGVDFLVCKNCGRTFCDCGPFVSCECSEDWCALNDDELRYHKILHEDKDYWGKIDWDFEVKCPCCGTKFEYSDSNM